MRNSDPVYVLDATPLIHFAKINKLAIALSVCKPHLTREVYKETVTRGGGRPDALVIRDAVESGKLKVYDVQNRRLVANFVRHPELDPGEAETLAAAEEMNVFAIIDEAEARAVAKTYGVQTKSGTLFLLFRLLALRRTSQKECENMLNELVKSGLYVDSATLIRAKDRVRYHKAKPK